MSARKKRGRGRLWREWRGCWGWSRGSGTRSYAATRGEERRCEECYLRERAAWRGSSSLQSEKASWPAHSECARTAATSGAQSHHRFQHSASSGARAAKARTASPLLLQPLSSRYYSHSRSLRRPPSRSQAEQQEADTPLRAGLDGRRSAKRRRLTREAKSRVMSASAPFR